MWFPLILFLAEFCGYGVYGGQSRTDIKELFTGLYQLGLHRSPESLDSQYLQDDFMDEYIPYNFPQDCYGYSCSNYGQSQDDASFFGGPPSLADQHAMAVHLFGEDGGQLASSWQGLTDLTNVLVVNAFILFIGFLLIIPALTYWYKQPENPHENRDYFLDQITDSIARATIVVRDNENKTEMSNDASTNSEDITDDTNAEGRSLQFRSSYIKF
eukprot:TRINITY_DN12941_c0_g1_i1.p1 TRINITY_DN12941_c0_g1~~TRINITY_DN12941_c0_g1_i1.p1  ORF type:complete len:214 (-),score=21.55 TRINITY_DN12941_c0_g1_i1:59-700(-)